MNCAYTRALVSLALLLTSGCRSTGDASLVVPSQLSTSGTVGPSTDPMWYFDFGVVGLRAVELGERPYFNFVSVGNAGSEPISLVAVDFPEVPRGLRITRIGLFRESEPERSPDTAPFPEDALPIDGSVTLEPTNGVVEDTFSDPRFFAVYVEVEVLAKGQWSVGPMDLTYILHGETLRKRISNQVGDLCTTAIDVPCRPSA